LDNDQIFFYRLIADANPGESFLGDSLKDKTLFSSFLEKSLPNSGGFFYWFAICIVGCVIQKFRNLIFILVCLICIPQLVEENTPPQMDVAGEYLS
jgi:hypothetical protein